VVVVAAVVVAGVVAVATRPSGPPTHARPPTTRVVALGDSVPYGHGLANPYTTPQRGLPATDVSEGPSTEAYPTLVGRALHLTLSVRPTNCTLVDDQLAISGAVADPIDNREPDAQCPVPPRPERNLDDEVAAADLPAHPARLVLLQAGADDIDFSACLEDELARIEGVGLGIGTACVANGKVTPEVQAKLDNVRQSLARVIESIAPHAGRIAVLDYYQPIPPPAAIADDSGASGTNINLVCTGLKANAAASYSAATVVSAALRHAIAGAVALARVHHVNNVTFVDIARVGASHGVCTTAPWFYSAQPAPDATLVADVAKIAAAKVCDSTSILKNQTPCPSLMAAAAAAKGDLKGFVWRAAHPTAPGQRAIAAAVEAQLRLH
jgi:hypothetical protein